MKGRFNYFPLAYSVHELHCKGFKEKEDKLNVSFRTLIAICQEKSPYFLYLLHTKEKI